MSHWYIRGPDGPTRYIQLTKDGKPRQWIDRERAIADGACEGVTSILRRLGDPNGLIQWAVDIAIDAGIWAAGSSVAKEDVRDLAVQYYHEVADSASEQGKQIHDAIESAIQGGPEPADELMRTARKEVMQWLARNLPDAAPWKSEHCVIYEGPLYSSNIYYGGTVDLVSSRALVDWKTVGATRGKYRPPKATECAQVAAYRLASAAAGLCRPEAAVYNVYLARDTGKIVRVIRWSENALEIGLRMLRIAYDSQLYEDAIEQEIKANENKP